MKDNPECIESLVEKPTNTNTIINIVNTISEGVEILNKIEYDIILLDPILPNGEGLIVYKQIRDIRPRIPIIIISDRDDVSLELIKAGAQDYLIRSKLDKSILNKSIEHAIQRKEIERKLHKEKNNNKFLYKTLDVLLNCASDIIWSKNMRFQYDVVNESLLKALGIKRENIIGKTVDNVFKTKNPDVIESDRITISTCKPYKVIERVFLDNGKILWWDVTKSPIFDDDGNIIGMVGTARDITEKVNAEKRIKEQLDKEILVWKDEQDKNMSEIRNNIADTVKQIDNFKGILNEYNRK